METLVNPTEAPSVPPQAITMQIAFGAMMSQALGVAARLGIADLLTAGPRTVSSLAADTSANEGALYRVLRSLSGYGVFRETSPNVFENTPVSDTLRSGVPGSMRNCAIFCSEPWHFQVWANMPQSVMTGDPVWKHALGSDVFDWFAQNPDAAAVFNNTMTEMSEGAAPAVVEAYDFSGIETLADIAGGHGFLLSQILKANPNINGILFDMEQVVDGADILLQKEGVAGRIKKISGDFFREVPSADAYIMKHIIHDWEDEKAIQILKNIHAAMNGSGRVLLVEGVVPEGNGPHMSKMIDLEMLTSTGGIERTAGEYGRLFDAAGFRLSRIVPTKSAFDVVEAVKK